MSPLSRPPRLRLITVDLDETVWPCLPVIRAAEEAVQEWLHAQAPALAAARDQAGLRAHRIELARRRPEIAHDITALRRASMAELLAVHGEDTALADAAVAVFLEARNRVEPFPEVLEVLERWRRRYRLVSVTNGNADVGATPLRGLFDHSLDAASVGAMRPDPALFHAALALAGAVPDEALHAGDDPRLDVAAAKGVGMWTAWVNRAGNPFPFELPRPDVAVQDLRALDHWLEEIDG
jgi:putative hydrolase of the HAD superfamily